jgi:DNA-3-methyladenine glycosylase II
MHDIVNDIDIEKLTKLDSIFAFIHETFGSPPNWKRPQGFVSLAKIIIEQQISLPSANAHFRRLNEYLVEFTPIELLKLTDEEMRSCQISRQKALYLRALASAIVDKRIRLERFDDLESSEIRRQLTSIKGIGEWTADIYLMFCLQEKDVFPYGDIAVMNAAKELSCAKTKGEIISLSEKWKPFRSLAAYHFWHYYLRKRNRPSELALRDMSSINDESNR